MKKIKKMLLIITLIIFSIWLNDLLYVEYLTFKFADDFYTTINEEVDVEGRGYYKILNYRPHRYARIYCVINDEHVKYACELIIIKDEVVYNDTVWSKSGSASEIIYPYWWHFIYGGL